MGLRFFTLVVAALLLMLVAAATPALAAVFLPLRDYGTGGGELHSVAVGDFNRDGNQDLVVADRRAARNRVSVFLGNEQGSFGARHDYSTGAGPYSVAIGDFNKDGRKDLATANEDGNSVSVLLGNGRGAFGAKRSFPTGPNTRWVAVGDFNNDGKLDLVATGTYQVDGEAKGELRLMLGDGSGNLAEPLRCPSGGWYPSSIAVADFNDDGKTDVVTSSHNYIESSTSRVTALFGDGAGGFPRGTIASTGVFPKCVAVGYFDDNDIPDLVTANSPSGSASILMGNGVDRFYGPANYAIGSGTSGVAPVDFNGDRNPDFVAASPGSRLVTVVFGDGSGEFQYRIDCGTGHDATSLAVGDFNKDGKPDIAAANALAGSITVLLQTPDLGKPSCPSTARVGQRFKVSGTLTEKARDGQVRVTAYRYVGGKWKTYKTYSASKVYSTSGWRYSASIKLGISAKYRLRASVASISIVTKSPYGRTMTVR